MSTVKLVEPYALRNMRKAVRESLQSHGEEVIALAMYHVDPDEGTQPHCVCFDDVYRQNETYDCDLCYGTGYEGGIKNMSRVWAMLTTDALGENHTKQGVNVPFSHQFHIEAKPSLMENDYLLRVSRWTPDYRPVSIFAAYDLKAITPESLRTGHQLGQDGNDYVGQRGKGTQLPTSHPIYKVFGRQVSPDFPVVREDGLRR